MIELEKTTTYGLEEAVRGMRNLTNGREKSDSGICKGGDNGIGCNHCACNPCDHHYDNKYKIGTVDIASMKKLIDYSRFHAKKIMRMISVYVDITAPLYWWKEFDTFKDGTVCISCSIMHKFHSIEFTLEDVGYGHLISVQKRTIMFNYEILRSIYKRQKNHELDEWSKTFCNWIESLPFSELITYNNK